MQNYFTSFFSSFGLHLALGIVLIFSVEFNAPEKPKPSASQPVVEAVSVDKSELDKQIKKIKQRESAKKSKEEKRIKDLERRLANAEKKKRQQEKDIKRLADKKKQADKAAKAAKARQIKEAKRAKELKKAADAKAAEKKKLESETAAVKKRAEAAKKKALAEAAERKRKAQAAKEKAEMERMMAEQLAAEQLERNKHKQKQILSETDKYKALIQGTIQRNLRVDETMKGKSCKLNIKLAASGFVINVRKLGGDSLVCNEAERAVIKAETLPVSEDPAVFNKLKDINLTVTPEF